MKNYIISSKKSLLVMLVVILSYSFCFFSAYAEKSTVHENLRKDTPKEFSSVAERIRYYLNRPDSEISSKEPKLKNIDRKVSYTNRGMVAAKFRKATKFFKEGQEHYDFGPETGLAVINAKKDLVIFRTKEGDPNIQFKKVAISGGKVLYELGPYAGWVYITPDKKLAQFRSLDEAKASVPSGKYQTL